MKSSTLIVLGLTCGACVASGQIARQTSRPLSLRECLDLALQHNLDVQIERYRPEIARYFLKGAYGAYEPVFNFQASKNFLRQPAAFVPDKFNIDYSYEMRTDTVGAGFLGLLPSGLSYDLSGRSDFMDADTD